MIQWFDCRKGKNRTSVRAVGLSSSLSQLCHPRRQKGSGGAAKSWQLGEESSVCSPAEEQIMREPWWFWPVELLCLMLPDFRTMRHLWGRTKSGTVNLHSVVSLNLIALSFFSFDTQCRSLLSSFTLFLSLIFVLVFFFVCKLCLAGDEISVSCLLQTVGVINKCWQTKTDQGLISRGQEINSKSIESGSRPDLPSCCAMED